MKSVLLNFSFEVRLVTLVHHMGGVIRKDFNSKVTHLVANCTQGEKFRVCKLEYFCVFQNSIIWECI